MFPLFLRRTAAFLLVPCLAWGDCGSQIASIGFKSIIQNPKSRIFVCQALGLRDESEVTSQFTNAAHIEVAHEAKTLVPILQEQAQKYIESLFSDGGAKATGQLLQELMRFDGKRQKQLAGELDVDQTFLEMVLTGVRKPTQVLAAALGRALNINETEWYPKTAQPISSEEASLRRSREEVKDLLLRHRHDGVYIRRARESQGWKQSALAWRLGTPLGTSTLSKLENGIKPLTPEIAVRMTEIFESATPPARRPPPPEKISGGSKGGPWNVAGGSDSREVRALQDGLEQLRHKREEYLRENLWSNFRRFLQEPGSIFWRIDIGSMDRLSIVLGIEDFGNDMYRFDSWMEQRIIQYLVARESQETREKLREDLIMMRQRRNSSLKDHTYARGVPRSQNHWPPYELWDHAVTFAYTEFDREVDELFEKEFQLQLPLSFDSSPARRARSRGDASAKAA